MDRHRSWDDVKRSRPQPSAEARAAIEREVDDELAAEIERVRADEDFARQAELPPSRFAGVATRHWRDVAVS